ncbi:MAG: hypothetical protein KAR42_17010 [candidate division Zixibacteria bacterium]|nr:hypothetical protein [candidate division Zixibacteria bacterium]
MRTTKTEDLVKFGSEEITFHVTFYKAGTMLRVQIFHAKTKKALKEQIRSYIDVQWPAEKALLSWKIR